MKGNNLLCDFCSEPEPYACYPANDLDASRLLDLPTNVKATSVGDWCACKTCYEMIERDDYEALSLRSAQHYPFEQKEEALKFLMALHSKFREWRIGPPHLLTEEP